MIYPHREHILIGSKLQDVGQITGEARETVGPPAYPKTIEPDLSIIVCAVQFEHHPFALIRRIHLEMPAIPGNTAGRVSVAAAAVGAKRALDAPVMRHVDLPPGGVVEIGLHRHRSPAQAEPPPEIEIDINSRGRSVGG